MTAMKKERITATPLARRIAQQKNVDLKLVSGSGPNGRIIRKDVDGYSAKPALTQEQSLIAQDFDAYEAIPNTGMRKVIARRLSESKATVPHFYLTMDCQIDELLSLRAEMNKSGERKVSVNDFVIRSVAMALQKVPEANASWTEEAILQYRHANVSVAVSTPTGLITPIIKMAESKSLSVLSSEMKDLASRAREGQLKPEEYQGGGFTISNLGMYGVKEFAPIINPPQACILSVGAGEQRPVATDGELAIATVMSCTLSVDHRAVDGAVGAQFLAAFKEYIENPYSMVM